MKKLPIIIVSVGCIITALIVSMTPTVKVVNNTTYSYFNYELLGIGFAISLLLGIIFGGKNISPIFFNTQ